MSDVGQLNSYPFNFLYFGMSTFAGRIRLSFHFSMKRQQICNERLFQAKMVCIKSKQCFTSDARWWTDFSFRDSKGHPQIKLIHTMLTGI